MSTLPEPKRRMTRQRRLICETLAELKTHPTAEEVFESVRKQLPRVSLGTVYRNLDILARSGEIRKLERAGAQARFDRITDEHLHVRCVDCGCVEDLDTDVEAVAVPKVRPETTFRIFGYRLEFDGLCPRCQAQGVSEQASAQS